MSSAVGPLSAPPQKRGHSHHTNLLISSPVYIRGPAPGSRPASLQYAPTHPPSAALGARSVRHLYSRRPSWLLTVSRHPCRRLSRRTASCRASMAIAREFVAVSGIIRCAGRRLACTLRRGHARRTRLLIIKCSGCYCATEHGQHRLTRGQSRKNGAILQVGDRVLTTSMRAVKLHHFLQGFPTGPGNSSRDAYLRPGTERVWRSVYFQRGTTSGLTARSERRRMLWSLEERCRP